METKSFEDILDEYGSLPYRSIGISMLPLIRESGDFILIHKRPPERLRKYDVVLFRRPNITGRGKYVLHRVMKVNPDGSYWIVGDNCVGGETVKEENILGILSTIRRGNKTIHITDFGYKLYIHLWCAPYPIRFFILTLKETKRRLAGKILRRLRLREQI